MMSGLSAGHALPPEKIFLASGTHFCSRMSKFRERLGKLIIFTLSGFEPATFPTCSIVPEPLCYRVPPGRVGMDIFFLFYPVQLEFKIQP
jgi:hypothetical protein